MGRLIDFDAELKALDIPSWSLYPDHKAITGDPSDNIPGCPETGAKRAHRLRHIGASAIGYYLFNVNFKS